MDDVVFKIRYSTFLLDQKRNKKVKAVNFIPFRIDCRKTKTRGNNADKIL
jgi:hypothetical protein